MTGVTGFAENMVVTRFAIKVGLFLVVVMMLTDVCFALGQRVLSGQPLVPSQPEVKTSFKLLVRTPPRSNHWMLAL